LINNSLAGAKAALEYKQRIRAAWDQVRIVEVAQTGTDAKAVGSEICVSAIISLGPLSPSDVTAQIVVGKIGPNRDLVETEMIVMSAAVADHGNYRYEAIIKCARPGHLGYTVRIVPRNNDIVVAHELPLVKWE
jgi:starch phosphorylase